VFVAATIVTIDYTEAGDVSLRVSDIYCSSMQAILRVSARGNVTQS